VVRALQPFSKLSVKIGERVGSNNPPDNTMARQITCECGYVAQGETDDEVVDLIEEHLRSDHPQLLAEVTRDDIAGWVEIVE
jgi:predicted small metal-binding protein